MLFSHHAAVAWCAEQYAHIPSCYPRLYGAGFRPAVTRGRTVKALKAAIRSYAAIPFFILGAVTIMVGSALLVISDKLAPDDIGDERASGLFFNRN